MDTKWIPTVLTILAGVGLVGTAILVGKETPEANEKLEEAKEEKGEDLTVKEKIFTVAKTYAPAAAAGTGTLLCMFGANALNKHQQAMLTSSYALLSEAFKKYRGKLIEKKGDEGKELDHDICDELNKEATTVKERADVHFTDGIEYPDIPMIFVEEHSGKQIKAYERDIIDAEYHLNRNLQGKGQVTVNDFLEFLGLDGCLDGDDIGWNFENMCLDDIFWIDFEHKVYSDDGGTPICEIIYCNGPSDKYMGDIN